MNLLPAQIILFAIIITFLLVFFLGKQFYYISNLVVLQALFFLFVIQYSQIRKFDTRLNFNPFKIIFNYPQLHVLLALILFQITQLIFTNNSSGNLFKLPFSVLIPVEYLLTIYILYSITSGYNIALSSISDESNEYNILSRTGFFTIYIALLINLGITLAKIILFQQAAAD